MNKPILLILTAAVALFALYGCNGGGDTAEASSTKEVVAPGTKPASDKPNSGMKTMQPSPPPGN